MGPDQAGGEARARFARPELEPLWQALRRRFERDARPVVRVTVGPLTPAQQAGVADLLGLPSLPDETTQVSVERLDRVLLASPARLDARGVVEAIGGPIESVAAAHQAERAARQELWTWLAAHPTVTSTPALSIWVEAVQAKGVVDGSVDRTRTQLKVALRVLDALPADGRPLAALANDLCGDPHALDDGRLATSVLRALAYLRDEPWTGTAEQRRLLWEQAGVACDALSTTVLVAGLSPAGSGPLATTLRTWAAVGHATQVTLAQLRDHPLDGTPAPHVRVVENPSVVAAAVSQFGPSCPPLICTSGWPSTAAVEFLRHLGQSGTFLSYHGDFDGDGLRIAAYMVAKTGADPWRMTAADYHAAVTPTGPPTGRVTDVPWDPALGAALRATGVAVPEEQVVATLLDDLVAG
jgi:uncharacterized protein (TIGR02679 family)